MLVKKNTYGYLRSKKYITGRGFVDTMSSIFNNFRTSVAPAIRNVASYVVQNKDLIAKPVLGAIGSLAAKGLSDGVPALISHIANRNRSRGSKPQEMHVSQATQVLDDPKYKEILQNIMTQTQSTPVSNIIGSGICSARRGSGIKTF
jgi:hypothetical protein